MKIAVICSNGKQGKLIVKEALGRGLDVTAIARSENKSLAKKFIKKDLFDLTKDDIKGFDILVDAFGAWTEKTLPMHTTSLMHLCDLVSNSNIRLLVVGGAGSLYTDSSHKIQLVDTPDFPDAFKPLAKNMADSLIELRKRSDVNWTYISPAADFQADGKRTGTYALAGEELTLNSNSESFISYSDYAIAFVDEVINNKHNKERISVFSK